MTFETLFSWLMTVMLTTVPPGHSTYPASARETKAEGQARYRKIARAIAKVTLDPKEKPIFKGPNARAKTAALLLVVSHHESHWRRHVDLGIGRGGRYWCMMQIAVDKGTTPEGWTGEDLIRSNERCFRRGLHMMQMAQRVCDRKKAKGSFAFLNHYASGHCDRGRKAVAIRVDSHRRWLKRFPLPKAEASTKAAGAGPKKSKPSAR